MRSVNVCQRTCAHVEHRPIHTKLLSSLLRATKLADPAACGRSASPIFLRVYFALSFLACFLVFFLACLLVLSFLVTLLSGHFSGNFFWSLPPPVDNHRGKPMGRGFAAHPVKSMRGSRLGGIRETWPVQRRGLL